MALINCPECGEKVSNKAAFCPHCGFPEPRESTVKYEVVFIDRVPKSKEYQVMTAMFNATGIDIDTCAEITRSEKPIVKTDMDFESADSLRSVLSSAGAPVIMREVGGGEVVPKIVRCPACGSSDYEVFENGFSIGKAVLGTLIAGTPGALAGFSGANNRYRVCSVCGHKW